MDARQDRARRVVAYLERRTVGNGCTAAEAEQAASKAAELRQKHNLGAEPVDVEDVDVFEIEIDPKVVTIILGFAVFYGSTFVREQVKRRKRPGARERMRNFYRR